MQPNRRWFFPLIGLGIVSAVDLPILTVAFNSFRTTENIPSSRGFLPSQRTLASYWYIGTRTRFWTLRGNSGVVAFATTALGLVLAALAGFAMSRFRARVLGVYNQVLLMVQMFPLILAIIPLFIFFRRLDLTNSFIPVLLVYTVTQLPFATWMLRSCFDSILRELDESAKVAGDSPLRAFFPVVLPLAAPGIAGSTCGPAPSPERSKADERLPWQENNQDNRPRQPKGVCRGGNSGWDWWDAGKSRKSCIGRAFTSSPIILRSRRCAT